MAEDKKKKKGTAVAVPPSGGGAVSPYDYGDSKGSGFEGTTSDDFAIPFMAVLQAMSPQVMKGKPEFRADASAGDLFNTVTGEVFSGEEGIVIVPCCRQYVTVEWQPRDKGGGMVGMHDPKSDIVTKAKSRAKEFGDFKTEDGNDLVDTFYLYCLLMEDAESLEPSGMPVVVAFTSTKIKKYRHAMSKWRAIKGSPPLYAFRVRLKVVPDSNTKGDFYNFDLSPALGKDYTDALLPPDHAVFKAGAQFMEQVGSGSMKADFSKQNAAGSGSGETVF